MALVSTLGVRDRLNGIQALRWRLDFGMGIRGSGSYTIPICITMGYQVITFNGEDVHSGGPGFD